MWWSAPFRARHDDRIPAGALGFEQRTIGGGKQRFEGIAMRWRACDADRDGDGERFNRLVLQWNGQRGGRSSDLVSERLCGSGVQSRQHDDELVAGKAAEVLARSQMFAGHARHESQRVVSSQVAKGVVHRLELIHVDYEQRHGGTGPSPFREHGGRDLHERAAHERTSEIVLLRDLDRREPAGFAWAEQLGGECGCGGASAPHELFEAREEMRVELLANLAAHDLHGFQPRERALVASFRRERVEHVGDAQHARRERDGLPRQTVRVALPIPPLVVIAHHWRDVPGELNVGKHLDTGNGVLADDVPLLFRQLALFVQHLRRHDQLSDVVQQRTDAEPEERRLIESRTRRQCGCQIRHPLAVPLGVAVLRLDRFAPRPDHPEIVAFQLSHAATDVGELVACAELREAGVCTIECLQRFAIPAQLLIELRKLAIRFAFEREIAIGRTGIARALQLFFRRREIARFARNDAVDLRRLAVRARVTKVTRKRHRPVASPGRFGIVALCHLEQRAVDFHLNAKRQTAKRIGDHQRFLERRFGHVEPVELQIGDTQVVERDDEVVEQGMTPAIAHGFLVAAKRLAEVAANLRQRAEIRHHVHAQPRIAHTRAPIQRFMKQLLGEGEVAFAPPRGREHVQRVAQHTAIATDFGCPYRGLRAVRGGAIVVVHFVGARDPAQQRGGSFRRRRAQCADRPLIQNARLGSPSHLLECARFVCQRTRAVGPDRLIGGLVRRNAENTAAIQQRCHGREVGHATKARGTASKRRLTARLRYVCKRRRQPGLDATRPPCSR